MTKNQKLLAIATLLVLTTTPNLYAAHCSTAASAGKWAYTYTGTIFTPNGPLPVASVGHFTADTADNLVGSQSRSVAGSSGVEDIAGTFNVNKDCTGTATINVLMNGQVSKRLCSPWPMTTTRTMRAEFSSRWFCPMAPRFRL